jgi:hypothetical protein
LDWSLQQVFRRTVSSEDESAQHILFTFESRHPYRPDERQSGVITISGATQLFVTFDKRCHTEQNSDILAFYEDEDLTKEARSSDGKTLAFRLIFYCSFYIINYY